MYVAFIWLVVTAKKNIDVMFHFSFSFYFFVLQDALQEIMGLTRDLPKKKVENPNKIENPKEEDS